MNNRSIGRVRVGRDDNRSDRAISGRGELLAIEQADARPALTKRKVVAQAPRRRQVDEKLRRFEPSGNVEPLARFERAAYGLRNRCSTPELQRQGRG
jgi:hypothetical protein